MRLTEKEINLIRKINRATVRIAKWRNVCKYLYVIKFAGPDSQIDVPYLLCLNKQLLYDLGYNDMNEKHLSSHIKFRDIDEKSMYMGYKFLFGIGEYALAYLYILKYFMFSSYENYTRHIRNTKRTKNRFRHSFLDYFKDSVTKDWFDIYRCFSDLNNLIKYIQNT